MTLSPIAAITEQLEEIVAKHGFTCIEIGLNTAQRDPARYSATLHFDNGLDGAKCILTTGATISEALNKAYRDSLSKRPQPELSLVSEAA